MEVWKDIIGYEGIYQISNFGNVKSLPRFVKGRGKIILKVDGCVRTPRIGKAGYYYLNLKKQGTSKTYKNHRLVAEYFVNGYKDGLVVNHKDGNKLNNHYSNLEWVTLSQNTRHALKLGLYSPCKGINHGQSKLTKTHVLLIRILRKKGIPEKKLSKGFNISKSQIKRIVNKQRWSHI